MIFHSANSKGYFKMMDIDTTETEFDADHLKMLAILLNHPEINTYVDSKPFGITIEVCGATYIVDCYDKDGDRILLVTYPFHDIYFPDIDHKSITWGQYNDAERCFEPFIQDPLLYSELNASFFANRMESTSMFQSLYMPRLSALRGEMYFMRYSKTLGEQHYDLVMDGICYASSKTVSVIRGC